MARERDLKLNTLDRYRKNSPGLILEEHSHCEVPAGCGGVVFRWIDPRDALPVLVRIHVTAAGADKNPGVAVTLDGELLTSARAMVRPGLHAFAFSVECPAGGALLFSARTERVQRSREIDTPFALDAAPDGRWRASTTTPDGDLWRHPGFDDALWTPLRAAPVPAAWNERAPYHIRQLLKDDVRPLSLPRAATLYVRCRFELSLAEAP